VSIEHARFTATNVPTLNQQQRYEIYSISMGTFWSRPANSVRGIDPELMGFYVPALYRRPHAREDGTDRLYELSPHGVLKDLGRYRLKPSLQATVERVVGRWLPVSSVGRQSQNAAFLSETGVTT